VKALDVLRYAFSDFSGNKFKTLMSSLGIIVGVMAIVVMLTLGEGLYQGVSQQLGDMQLDTMVIMPGDINAVPGSAVEKPPAELTDRDVRLLANVPGVTEVSPQATVSVIATCKGENRTVTLTGIDPKLEQKSVKDVGEGRFLSPSDVYYVVLGSKAAESTFRKAISPGMYINLTNPYTGKSHDYKVCGILKPQNGSVLAGDPDSSIYVTMAGMKEIASTDSYAWIGVRADSVDHADAVAAAAETALKNVHKNEAFSVVTQKMFSEAIAAIFDLIKMTLAGIGSVSLVVGGIGITNVMMLTVRERVKEIGLMKAVGATRSQVRWVFLAESQLIGLASGVIGVLVAAVIAFIVGSLANLPMGVSLQDGIIGILFAVATTTFAGVYPALQASKMNPIEALRTE
jgi:putative ABC transport system permease protein